MGRFRRNEAEEYQRMRDSNPNSHYDIAYKRMRRIKRFYVHLGIYILANTFFIVAKHYDDGPTDPNFWRWQTFNTALFWGMCLLVHGLSVFGTEAMFSRDWEEKKIRQIMDQENEQRKKWN